MGAVRGVPQPFPYQGSKRQLASQIVACIPRPTTRLVEPFAGSGAITLAAAHLGKARLFLLSDIHKPLIELWKTIAEKPQELADRYETLWLDQSGQERNYYDEVRKRFNTSHEPHLFLYLLARCVKAAVRYNSTGQFNNSPDNRRIGMRPATMRRNLIHTSTLLRGRVSLSCQDYQAILAKTNRDDVVYMDPPYQGVCDTRDHRYCGGVDFGSFVARLNDLNQRHVPFIVSYDGRTGQKTHGRVLPPQLELVRLEVQVGRSTQATLLGREDNTVESLYLSPALLARLDRIPDCLTGRDRLSLFGRI